MDPLNIVRPGHNIHHFADNGFKGSFLNENILVKISLEFLLCGSTENIIGYCPELIAGV